MDLTPARVSMVKSQIRPNQVDDEVVLEAMLATPREAFLPKALHGIAYVDEDLPLGNGRFMMEPLVLARLLQAAVAKPDDIGLVIGCATGYTPAVLSRMVSAVVAVESEPGLVQKSSTDLTDQGIDTVAVIEGSLSAGYAKQAPFDVILFDGAVDEVPEEIAAQLAEGGRLLAVVRKGPRSGQGVIIARNKGILSRRELFDANIPYLPGFEPKKEFEF